jgi:hypothetical protein
MTDGAVDRAHIARLMAHAGPPDYRRPRPRSWWSGFLNVLNEFFADVGLEGRQVLDLGPGHFHFEMLLSAAGAEVTSVERDAALAAVGRALGYRVIESQAWGFPLDALRSPVDGVFSKFSLRAFEARTPEEIDAYTQQLDGLLKSDGWGWIAPWNGPVGVYPKAVMDAIAQRQVDAFRRLGWDCYELSEEQATRFGVRGITHNRPLFTKNLRWDQSAPPAWTFERLTRDAGLGRVSLIEPPLDSHAYVVADPPAWRWIADRLDAMGYVVELSFNAEFDEILPWTRGALLVVACVAGCAVLPKAFHPDWLPVGEGDLLRRLRDEPSGMLAGQNARGSTVVVLWAPSDLQLKEVVAKLDPGPIAPPMADLRQRTSPTSPHSQRF